MLQCWCCCFVVVIVALPFVCLLCCVCCVCCVTYRHTYRQTELLLEVLLDLKTCIPNLSTLNYSGTFFPFNVLLRQNQSTNPQNINTNSWVPCTFSWEWNVWNLQVSFKILKDNGQFPEGWVGQEAVQLKDALKYSLKYQAFYCTQHSIINWQACACVFIYSPLKCI